MSQSPGISVIPSVLIVGMPDGTDSSLAGPTARIRSPSISTTPFSMTGPP